MSGWALSPAWHAAAAADEVHSCLRCQVEKITGAPAAVSSPPTFDLALERVSSLLVGAWDRTSTPHIEQAVTELLDLSESKVLDSRRPKLAAAIVTRLDAALADRSPPLTDAEVSRLAAGLAATYRLGKAEVGRELGWSVSFRLADQDAIAGLTANGVWWVGKTALTGSTSGTLQSVALRVLEQGLGRREAGEAFAAAIGDVAARSRDYWEGFAAVYLTRSRSFGALTAMQEMGGRTYTYVNPLDERTSSVCRELAGTEFTVRESVRLRDRLLGSRDPDAWRSIAPWPSHADVVGTDGQRLPADELQRRGIAMPPLHMHCRSAIDVQEFEADEALPPPPPPVEKPAPKRTRAPRAAGAAPQRRGESAKAREQAYLAARQAIVAEGWSPDVLVYPDDLVQELRQAGVWVTTGYPVPDSALRFTIEELRSVPPDSPRAAPAASVLPRLERALALHDAHLTAATRYFEVATPKARHAARLAATRGMVDPGQEDLAVSVAEALEHWAPELVILLRRQGVRVFDVGDGRAYCRPFGARGGPEAAVDASGARAARESYRRLDARATIAHELAHALDNVMAVQGNGVGTAWSPGLLRALERPVSSWETGLRGTFDAIRAKGGQKPYYMGDPQGQSEYAWQGSWVDPYEARIYSGSITPDMVGWSSILKTGSSGPVEFIAQQQTYVGLGTNTGWRVSRFNAASPQLAKAVDTYPAAYFAGIHQLYRTGPNYVAARGREALGATDRQVAGSMVALHTHLGMPLDEAFALVRPYLAAPESVDLAAVRAVIDQATSEGNRSLACRRVATGIADVGAGDQEGTRR